MLWYCVEKVEGTMERLNDCVNIKMTPQLLVILIIRSQKTLMPFTLCALPVTLLFFLVIQDFPKPLIPLNPLHKQKVTAFVEIYIYIYIFFSFLDKGGSNLDP